MLQKKGPCQLYIIYTLLDYYRGISALITFAADSEVEFIQTSF